MVLRQLIILLLSCYMLSVPARELYFVDAHSQADDEVEMPLILDRMASNGVAKTILAARSGRSPFDVANFADASGGRIIAALRTKSGAYTNNPAKFYRKIEKQYQSGRFSAMGEVLLYHAQKGDLAHEVTVLPEDERVQHLLRIARQEGWPFVIHIEFASLEGGQRQRFMKSMQTLLSENEPYPIVLNHMGQLGIEDVDALLRQHSNIYFLLAHTNPYIINRSNEPWINIFHGKVLDRGWRRLIITHPKHFIFALDNVWRRHWTDFYDGQMAYWLSAMADLPPEVAHAVAHGNAEHLWHLE